MKTDKTQKAVSMMIRTNHMHRALIDLRVKNIGIHRTQHKILMHLARCEKMTSQKELADHLGITPAAVTGAIKKIERDGYIKRTAGKDNRFMELEITDSGKRIVDLSREIFQTTDRSLFEGFTDEELESYVNCLEKLEANIRSQLGDSYNKCNSHSKEKTDEKMV